MESYSRNIDEPITITEYNPLWPSMFESESERVRRALADFIIHIEHFGSTAVPGMAGKPIVDLLVGVKDLNYASEEIPLLEEIGYENFGEIFFKGRLYLRYRGRNNYNIAMTVEGSDFWKDQIVIRDYLRTHLLEVEAYSDLKRLIYLNGSQLFSTYSQAKNLFMTDLKVRAMKWKMFES